MVKVQERLLGWFADRTLRTASWKLSFFSTFFFFVCFFLSFCRFSVSLQAAPHWAHVFILGKKQRKRQEAQKGGGRRRKKRGQSEMKNKTQT